MSNSDNLKPWKKGESGNPGGMSKIDAALKKNKNLSKKVIKAVGDILLMGDVADLERLAKEGNTLEKWVATIIVEGIKNADVNTFDKLMPWFVGKIKEEVEVSTPRPTVIHMKNGEKLLLGSKIEGEDDETT